MRPNKSVHNVQVANISSYQSLTAWKLKVGGLFFICAAILNTNLEKCCVITFLRVPPGRCTGQAICQFVPTEQY